MHLKSIVKNYSLLIVVASLVLFPSLGLSEFQSVTPHSLVPEREIILNGQKAPEWKLIWDQARRLAKAGDYKGAIEKYEFLLSQKKNIEEARWELARLHMHLQHWDKAGGILELLIEADPQQVQYLNGLGRVMWEKSRFDRSGDLFRRAYELDHDDPVALAGVVEGLIKLEKKEEALPFLERLHLLQPDNLGIHRYLAMLTYELALYEKARALLVDLAEKKEADTEILLRAAQAHDQLGLSNIGADYWRRVLLREPDHIEAHSRLADFLEGVGRVKEALPHLLALLKKDDDNAALLARIGLIYENLGQFDQALSFYKLHLQQRPDNLDVLRSMVKIYAAKGNKDKTLAALEQYFKIKPDSEPADLKLAASLYDAAGRFHKAIPLYRQLIDISPEDPEILASLANDLLAIGENEGALSLWKHLAKVTSDPLPIYRSMAELLDRLDRNRELIEVLEVIHDLDSTDEQTTLKLAISYLDKGDLNKSFVLFEKLSKTGYRSSDFLLGRGSLYEKMNRPEQALKDYETLLYEYPDRRDICLHFVRLAGKLGRVSVALEHLNRLLSALPEVEKSGAEPTELKLERAKLFQENGFYEAAIKEYRTIILGLQKGASDDSKGFMTKAWLEMAASYREAGLYYEAEQVLREVLSSGYNRLVFIDALLELALTSGSLDDGEIWLDELHKQRSKDWRIRLLEARLLARKGGYRAAIKICRSLLASFSTYKHNSEQKATADQTRLKISLTLGRFLLESGKLTEAEQLGQNLLNEGWKDLEIFVLLQQIRHQVGDWATALDISKSMAEIVWEGDIHKADLGDFLRLASLYNTYDNIQAKYNFALAALQRAPDSLKAQFLFAEAKEAQGKLYEALELLRKIRKDFPTNTKAITEMTRLLFQTGHFEGALAQCESILESQPNRSDILLLKARILWANHQWKNSAAIYQKFLAPPISELLAEKFKEQGIVIDLRPESSFWSVITFSEGELPDLAEVVMSPSYAIDTTEENNVVNILAAPMYARYRWQNRFAFELKARRSVQRREYNQAADLYETMIKEYVNDESLLFDLAGIYSRLGRLGDEAALYERLEMLNPEFPGLADAVQRNLLKRRPRMSIAYGTFKEDGREGYKAIKKRWGEVKVNYSPRAQHEVEFNAFRIKYQAVNDDMNLWSKRFFLSYDAKLSSGLSAAIGVGVESFDDGSSNFGVFSCSFLGKIGDKLKSRFAFGRDLTTDTIASLTRNIFHDDIEADFAVDFFPRLSIGGDFGYKDYSDNNQKYEYTLWSTYIIFFEPTLLKLSYSYDFEDFREGPKPGEPLEDGFAIDDHPYYTPTDYWLNSFSLFFKHKLSADTLDRGIPSYYTIEYTIGYDSEDEDLQALRSSFFVEFTKHFIINASASVSKLESFKSREMFFSAVYRW